MKFTLYNIKYSALTYIEFVFIIFFTSLSLFLNKLKVHIPKEVYFLIEDISS